MGVLELTNELVGRWEDAQDNAKPEGGEAYRAHMKKAFLDALDATANAQAYVSRLTVGSNKRSWAQGYLDFKIGRRADKPSLPTWESIGGTEVHSWTWEVKAKIDELLERLGPEGGN